MGFIGRSWRGDEDLWKVFWIYGVLLSLVLGFVLPEATGLSFIKITTQLKIQASIWVPYLIWNTVSLWRCAWDANWSLWGGILRVLIALCVVSMIILALVAGPVFGVAFKAVFGKYECADVIRARAVAAGQDPAKYGEQHPQEIEDCLKEKMGDSKNFQTKITSQTTRTTVTSEVTKIPKSALTNPDDVCELKLAAHAINNKLDIKTYIAQNQAWMNQCHQSPNTPISLPTASAVPSGTVALPASPVVPSVPSPGTSPAYTSPCEQKMADYAIANHTDPKAYIAANQAYLQQCMASIAAPATPH